MFALPHFSSRIIVGVISGCITVLAWSLACSMRGFPDDPQQWLLRLVVRFIADIQRGNRITIAWIGLAWWSVTVTVLHFAGLSFGIYPAVSWWDLLTHAMSGFGIAAVALLVHRSEVAMHGSVWWIIPFILAVGAGFEVYEFVFKDFWHGWTLQQYTVDTVVDLGMNMLGAAVVASVVRCYRALVIQPRANSIPNYAD